MSVEPADREPTSEQLIRLANAGNKQALEALFARQLPRLHRWTHYRMPGWIRSLADTADIVQEVMLTTFRRLDAVEIKRRGALQAYLRQGVTNRIRDHHRAVGRKPLPDQLEEGAPVEDTGPSPLTEAIDNETRARYMAALAKLKTADQELVVGRIELGYSYEQLAEATGRPGSGAARMALRRAILRLADHMSHG